MDTDFSGGQYRRCANRKYICVHLWFHCDPHRLDRLRQWRSSRMRPSYIFGKAFGG